MSRDFIQSLDPEYGLSPRYGPSGAKELKGQDWEGGGEGILYYGRVYDRIPEYSWLSMLASESFLLSRFV